MGATEIKNGTITERISLNYFEFKYIIGRGGFGKVWKVTCKKNNKDYAMKVMSKVKIIDKKSEKSIMAERTLLSKLHHPFLVNMVYSFQDADNLYLVMDLLLGGDLRYHLGKHRKFSQEQTKFFIGCVLLGLEYIHENKVIHRDIKPENLVCDENGYIRITDFGIAKNYHKVNKTETSGTPGYMAPEVLCSQNHSYPVDYFAIGVICYEFMLGKRPYHGKGRKEVKQDVISHQVKVVKEEIPTGWSYEAADFINSLIQRKAEKRLGSGGIEEVKNHKWFNGFEWKLLYNKKLAAPFVPKKGDNYNKKYCEAEDKIGDSTLERYQRYKNERSYIDLFERYTCNNIPKEEIKKCSKIKDHNRILFKNNTISGIEDIRIKNLKEMKSKTNVNSLNITKNYIKGDTPHSNKNSFKTTFKEGKFTKVKFFNKSKINFLQNNNNINNELSFCEKKTFKKSNLPLINLNTSRALKKSNSTSQMIPSINYNNNQSVKDNFSFSSKLYFLNKINNMNPYQKYPINIEQARLRRSTSSLNYVSQYQGL